MESKHYAFLLSSLFPVLAPAAGAQATAYTLYGSANGDAFGSSVASVGDVDLDGVDDVLVGIPGATPNGTVSGRARLYSGRDRSVLYTWNGSAEWDFFGISVAAAGDVNHDGHPDVIVGASGARQGNVLLGKAVIYSGANGAVLRVHWGERASGEFGARVLGLGDVDGDGWDDVAISAPRESLGVQGDPNTYVPNAGVVRVYSGATGALLFTHTTARVAAEFGWALARLADDASGEPVLGVGAPKELTTGRAYRIVGSAITDVFVGPQAHGWFGTSLCSLGDLNGDGVEDLAIGAPYDGLGGYHAGRVHFVSGASHADLQSFTGTAEDEYGYSVAPAGDVDHDGRQDLFVGVPGAQFGLLGRRGKVLVLGGDGAMLASFTGATVNSWFGGQVASGDFNGDGATDLLAGAASDATVEINAGSARIVFMENAAGTPFCFGDGSGNPCPCNSSPAGARAGCPNSTGAAGKLVAQGRASIAQDDVLLRASGIPNAPCLFFQGTTRIDAGAGATFGDGLRCAGGAVKRLGVRQAQMGTASFPASGGQRISTVGGVIAGQTLHYQVWYRDNAAGFCTSATHNFTNGYSIAWQL